MRSPSRWKALLFIPACAVGLLVLWGCNTPVPTTDVSPVAMWGATPTAWTALPLAPTATPEPTSLPQSVLTSPLTSPALELVILHTNDTWGYVLPCG